MADKAHEQAEVLGDVFLEAGLDVGTHLVRTKGGFIMQIYGSTGDNPIASVRVLDGDVSIDWALDPSEIFGVLHKARIPNVGQPAHGIITPETVVYSAAAWWRDSDPFTSVVALDKKRAEDLIEESMQEEADRAADSDDEGGRTVEDFLDDIRWSGVHAEKLGTLAPDDEFEKAADALIEDGYWRPELP